MGQSAEQKPVVLYVDDIKANLMLFEASFENDFDVLLADSGKEALEILAKKEVHVLVSDQNMPGITGNELLGIVTVDYPDIMRFMITAYTDYETVVEAINKGHLYGFFNKPYNIDEVRHSISKSLEVRNLRIRNREMIEKLAKANEIMLNLDRSKTNFLTAVTDEIRTPINKIMTAVHMIKDRVDSRELTELLQLLDVSVNRLEEFSESAKLLVRLNSPDFKLKSESISLHEIIEVGIIERGNNIRTEKIAIKLDETSSDLKVNGEFDLVMASFSTLLGYIIDHAKEGTEIIISLRSIDGTGKLEILSEGGTYSEKEQNDLKALSDVINEFVDKDLRMEVVLANEIMAAHGGSLTFFYDGKKSGFSMLFPVSAVL